MKLHLFSRLFLNAFLNEHHVCLLLSSWKRWLALYRPVKELSLLLRDVFVSTGPGVVTGIPCSINQHGFKVFPRYNRITAVWRKHQTDFRDDVRVNLTRKRCYTQTKCPFSQNIMLMKLIDWWPLLTEGRRVPRRFLSVWTINICKRLDGLTWQPPSSQRVTWQVSVHAVGRQVGHVTQHPAAHFQVSRVGSARITWEQRER